MKDKLSNNVWMSKKYIYETCLQLVLGLKAIHARNVLHLDIKPANVLLGLDLKWKWTDLGVSKNVNEEIDHTVNLKGITACYSSPEQYQLYQFQSHKKITKLCDVYSLGVVFMELTGVDVRKKWVIKQKIRQKPFDKYLNPDFQEFNQVLINNMVAYNSNSRITLEEAEIVLKNLIAGENKENSNKSDSQETTQEEGIQKSTTFTIEENSPVKQQKHIHVKSYSISDEKQFEIQTPLQLQQYQASKQGSSSPNKKMIIPIDKIQQFNQQNAPVESFSPNKKMVIPIDKIQQFNQQNAPVESPDNSPLKRRSVRNMIRGSKVGSQTPVSGASGLGSGVYMSGMSITPIKQRIISSNNLDQQEIQVQQKQAASQRRAASLHQSQQQEVLPPITIQSRNSQIGSYNNMPSPISYMKRSFMNQNPHQNMLMSSQVIQGNANQSPINMNKKASSKSFSQKIIIPKKLIPTNFQQAAISNM